MCRSDEERRVGHQQNYDGGKARIKHDYGEWSEPPRARANAKRRPQGSTGGQRQCERGKNSYRHSPTKLAMLYIKKRAPTHR